MKKLILTGLLMLVPVALSACNTVEGMGQDMKQGGAAIEKAADQNK